jgi:hypothetical protein
MKSLFRLLLLTVVMTLSGERNAIFSKSRPKTQGDPSIAARSGYQPLDAFSAQAWVGDGQAGTLKNIDDNLTTRILKEAVDETMRMSIRQLDVDAGVEASIFGKANYKSQSFVLTMDFTKTLTVPVLFAYNTDKNGNYLLYKTMDTKDADGNPLIQGSLPVYVGVGVRITATITTNSGDMSFNLAQLGVKGDAKQIQGSLVIQTLGMSGETITSSLPVPSEINSSTIQNALLATGAIKTRLYDAKTEKRPRVVGFYNAIGGGDKFLTAFISFIQTYKPLVMLEN